MNARLALPDPQPLPDAVLSGGACRGTSLPGFTCDPPSSRASRAVKTQYSQQVDAAKAVCAQCPVMAQCLAWAMTEDDACVYGGTTAAERRHLGARPASFAERRQAMEVRALLHRPGMTVAAVAEQTGYPERTLWRHKAHTTRSRQR